MARDAVAITALSLNGGVARPAGTTISVANGAYADVGFNTDKLIVEVRNTAGAEYDLTIPAGNGPTSDLGDLVVPVAATTGVQLICVESARFVQSTGYIHFDFETSMTGTIAVYRLPDGV